MRNPWMLLLLVPVALAAVWVYRRKPNTIKMSSLSNFTRIKYRGLRSYIQPLVPAVLFLSLAVLVAALAGPRRGIELIRRTTEGVDIVLCIDVSGSMGLNDMDPNVSRLDLVKTVVDRFIDERKDDQLGLVVFAKRAYRLVPVTSDHELLKQFLENVSIGMVDESRTAIGDALAKAVDVVSAGKAKSKVIILLSDGANNTGSVQPTTATELARALHIRCYTVGAGTDKKFIRSGFQTIPVDPIDENLLSSVAERTGGKYFRAKDLEGLKASYDEIDRLEKTEIKGYSYRRYHEFYPLLVGISLVGILCWLVFEQFILRSTA